MIEELIRNEHFRRIFPPLAALGLIALFVSLGAWQLDRAAEKNRRQALFENDTAFTPVEGDMPVTEFQNIEARGHYLDERQVLIDNMIVDGRIGYYAITAFRFAADKPLLIVNRGWIPRSAANEAAPDLGTGADRRTIRGRAGHLPKVGIRSREAFAGADDWPKRAIYPTLDELSAELGEELLPFILLLDPHAENGFFRRWQPRESGPMTHYGYAFQWFAMATAVLGILLWRVRKRRSAAARQG
jgi:surfeit locus 1 family protein